MGKSTQEGVYKKNVHSTVEKREIFLYLNKKWRQPNIRKTINEARIICKNKQE